MKTRGIKDLYLPKKIAIHVKFILVCAAITPIWAIIIKAKLDINSLFSQYIVIYATLEAVHVLFRKIFAFKYGPLKKEMTRKEYTQMYLFRMLLFFIAGAIAVNLIILLYLFLFHLIRGFDMPSFDWFLEHLKGAFKALVMGFLVYTPILFYVPWQQSMKREFELREQNLIFQNETLKNQVNPHFLFNSLNTLASLVNNEVELASRFIGKLSLIYRYILDNSTKTKIALKDEIDFIRDYFYMHQIRNEGKINLNIDIRDKEYNLNILPVSLQLLIENAIKHNMATDEKPLQINIYIEEKTIVVKNNMQKMASMVDSTKIGLKNLNERVKFITGKELHIEETPGEFIVKVPLLL